MIMGVDNLVGLRGLGLFYTGFICQGHRNGAAKGIFGFEFQYYGGRERPGMKYC